LGIALAATASAATPSLKENLGEALYTESVLRSPQTAAGMFAKIVESYRNAGSPAELSEHAAAALFRLAEIRDEEGAQEEAKKLYREIHEQFPNQEPQAELARRKLGLSGPDARTKITQIEQDQNESAMADNVFSKSWILNINHDPGDLLLMTFKVSHGEGYANEGLPAAFEVNTLHHVPSGNSAQLITHTTEAWPKEIRLKAREDDGVSLWDRRNFISAFGQTFEVPEGLTWRGDNNFVVSTSKLINTGFTFVFNDSRQIIPKDAGGEKRTDITKELSVTLDSEPVSHEEAMKLLEPSGTKLPETGVAGWSLTVPPSITSIEEQNSGE
jgi:tetratricopeptide (TPR) repeat protein